MRIVDYLNSDDDGGDRHEAAAADAPIVKESVKSEQSVVIGGKTRRRKLIPRLFSFAWKCGGGRVTRSREHEEMEVEEGEEHSREVSDSGGAPARFCEECGVGIATSQNRTGCDKQEWNFNLVVGLGLLSLVAVNRMEIEKTMELRRKMESFFQNLKEECQSKSKISEASDSEISLLNEDVQHSMRHFDHRFRADPSPQLSIGPSEITLVSDQFSKSNADAKEECVEGMNHFVNLEVELESELELLQLHLQTEEPSQHQWQNRESGWQSADTEMEYHQQTDNIEQCGVNPLELERRLHELIEARQEERIKELESVLKQTKQKLQEHEMEASWLQDTIMIISEHLCEFSSVSR